MGESVPVGVLITFSVIPCAGQSPWSLGTFVSGDELSRSLDIEIFSLMIERDDRAGAEGIIDTEN